MRITSPGLPMKPGRAGTMTHDYKRHGTTTLFAALNILDGTVIGRNMQHHRHQEFIRFLNAISRRVHSGGNDRRSDNYANPKHPKGAPMAGAASPLKTERLWRDTSPDDLGVAQGEGLRQATRPSLPERRNANFARFGVQMGIPHH